MELSGFENSYIRAMAKAGTTTYITTVAKSIFRKGKHAYIKENSLPYLLGRGVGNCTRMSSAKESHSFNSS